MNRKLLLLLWLLIGSASWSQDDSLQQAEDWCNRYNSGGIQQGGFLNANPDNFFGRGITGAYLGFHTRNLYTNVELDFLFGGYRKFFKQLSNPGGQISMTYTVYRWKNLEIQLGMATAFRSQMTQYARIKELKDTLNMDFTGTSSTFSRGAVLRGTYRFGGERSKFFSEVGIQLSYLFDFYAYGRVYQSHGAEFIDGAIPGKYRLQRDAFALQVRLGLGQYTRKRETPKIDPELEIEEP